MKKSIFEEKKFVPLFALIPVFAWSCAYPLIKLGLIQFQIDNSDTGSKTLFAGVRFILAGLLTLIFVRRNTFSEAKIRKNIGWIFLFAITNTTLHYFCFYLGLSNSVGSRAPIFDSLGTFLLVILACLIFSDEHFTKNKAVGCVLGFSGVLILNLGDLSGQFSLEGDGMMILNACCAAFGGILTRIVCKKINPVLSTGLSLSLGGLMLIALGIILGGHIEAVTLRGCIILGLLVLISSVGFSVYNQLLIYHPVGQVAIYNSLIPVFGIILSCIFLGEAFEVKYLFAGCLSALGVFVINFNKREQKKL